MTCPRPLLAILIAALLAGCGHGKASAVQYGTYWGSLTDRIWEHFTVPVVRKALGADVKEHATKGVQTTVSIEVREDGTLARVEVAQSSGVPEFDEVAVTAVKKAPPFPPPPGVDEGGGASSVFIFSYGPSPQGLSLASGGVGSTPARR